jgi:uncharacterized protein YggE
MPVKSPAPSRAKNETVESHDCCFTQSCGRDLARSARNMDYIKKFILTLLGIMMVYGTVFLGTLIRNNIQKFYHIGKADKMERTISLDAQGKVTVVPDIAETSLGMTAEATTVAEAQQKNTEVMNKLIERLKSLGIEAKDIQTAGYNVFPQYNYTEIEGQTLKGYQVVQNVNVKIRDLSKANAVLGLAGEVGINNVSGLNFTVDDRDVYKAKAREIALKKVQEKAAILSQALGVKITGVVTFSEYESTPGDYSMYKTNMMESGVGAPNPTVEPGTTDIILTVNVIYSVE